MKTSKDDGFNVCVNYYLKKRKYILVNMVKEKKKQKGLTLREMVTNTIMDNISASHAINGRLVNFNDGDFVQLVEDSFASFINFINNSNAYITHLRAMIFPCFINFFVKLLVNGHKEGAKNFLIKYQSQFSKESQNSLINSCQLSIKDNFLNPTLVKFIECRHKLSLDKHCHNYLFTFLQNLKEQSLLNECIPRYFDINIIQNSTLSQFDIKLPISHSASSLSSSSSSSSSSFVSSVSSSSLPTFSNFSLNHLSCSFNSKYSALNGPIPSNTATSQEEIEQLENSFTILKDMNPCLPCTYVGYLEGYNPCCVDIRTDTKYFGAGFENSEIHIWSISAPSFRSKSFVNIFQVGLAFSNSNSCNNLNDTNLSVDTTPSGANVLRGHFGPVYDISFVQNFELLISCSEDCSARLWNLNHYKNTFVYSGHLYPIWTIDSSPLELYFVTGSKDTTARLWSFERLHPLRIFAGHTMNIDVVKFHPNALYVATGSSDNTVRLWSVKNGQMVRIFEGHKAGIVSLTFSPDGRYLASGSDDCVIKIWDLRTSKLLANCFGHCDAVNDLCFNADGSNLISASKDKTLKFWDMKQIRNEKKDLKQLLQSIQADFPLMRVKMLPHNSLYAHGYKL